MEYYVKVKNGKETLVAEGVSSVAFYYIGDKQVTGEQYDKYIDNLNWKLIDTKMYGSIKKAYEKLKLK